MDGSVFLSAGFDWVMSGVMAVATVLILSPLGEAIVDFCSPKDAGNQKRKLKGEQRKQYKTALALFCGALAVIELLAAVIMDIWPPYSMIYVVLILVDIILFGRFTKKMFP